MKVTKNYDCLTQSKPMFLSITPENIRKLGFFIFSGGTEKNHWPEMG